MTTPIELPTLNNSPTPNPNQAPAATGKRRPFGLKAIITLLVVQALFSFALILLFILALSSGELATMLADPQQVAGLSVSLLILPLVAPLRMLAAFGLWRLKRWAWLLTMTLLAYSMTVDAISFFQGRQFYYLAMIFNVLTVFYLNQREVQELFVQKRSFNAQSAPTL